MPITGNDKQFRFIESVYKFDTVKQSFMSGQLNAEAQPDGIVRIIINDIASYSKTMDYYHVTDTKFYEG